MDHIKDINGKVINLQKLIFEEEKLPVIAAKYNPDAKSDKIKGILGSLTLDNPDLISYLQRILGSCLTKKANNELYIFYGSGNNGKNFLNSLMSSVLGNCSIRLPFEYLMKKCDFNYNLGGERMILIKESNMDDYKLDTGKIKSLISEPSYLSADGSVPKLFITSNSRLIIPDDRAFKHRIVVIPFNTKFVGNPGYPNERRLDAFMLDHITDIDRSAFLNWLIEGARLCYDSPTIIPECVKHATNNYLDQ